MTATASSAPRDRLSVGARIVVGCLLVSAPLGATVTEPNGVVVPGVPSQGGTPLWDFFESEGETFDAEADASAEPGVFSPLCDFEATLVESESSAQAGISWYNVPDDPEMAPATIVELVPEGTPIGQTVTAADIRSSAEYAGGLIGFVLTKGGTRVYYSEFMRNAFCSQCMYPDYWKMMLSYPSTQYDNTYYLAFEDWEGANDTTWHGNDGDFNDKVFRVTGVACPGGGEPCETGEPGLCTPGLTECEPGGDIVCVQLVDPVDEVCDGLDNDCDGEIDNGDLCAEDEVCDRGECVGACGDVLFNCTDEEVCSDDGFCVDAACADVECEPGTRCIEGECRAPCEGVVCPAPLTCLAGRCADPCADVTCETGRVCDQGVCVMSCDCHVCDLGEECDPSGVCVDDGCAGVSCDAGTVCRGGECVDSCTEAVCPIGEKCLGGECVDACTDVTCDSGQKCDNGVCVDSCSGIQCNPGLKCVPGDDEQGQCVDGCLGVDCGAGQQCMNGSCGSSCEGVTCPEGEECSAGSCSNPCAALACAEGEVCRGGECVDSCSDIQCAAGQVCQDGLCIGTPVVTTSTTSGSSTSTTGAIDGSGGTGMTDGAPLTGRESLDEGTSCNCRLPGATRVRGTGAMTLLVLLGVVGWRRRSAPRRIA